MVDLLFTGGRVLGVEGDAAVAVRDGRIVAVGGPEIRSVAGPTTSVVDLQGGLLVPGFTDAHAHPIQGGLELAGCDVSDLRTQAGYLARIREHVDASPELD